MLKNLVYDLRPDEIQTAADKVRESELVWNAVEAWAKARLTGISRDRALIDLNQILEMETDYYVNDWREERELDEEDGPWEAA